ncbi:MAG: putative bifunctional phosphatase/peptidyl-prolyl cis-trans isomerase [Calditrichaeota bacterium]|nr:putative bifunctional phosphatase/peptidyl-prolyl cis-trans isomerase [Calditrichota bacterium]
MITLRNSRLRFTAAAIAGLLIAALIGCGGGVKNEVAVMETDFGEIVLGFYPDDAPNHVSRFKQLARDGVYDGVLFHRVVPGFVIQAGDPLTKNPDTPRAKYGSGGTGDSLTAEFNERRHVRGTLGMARSRDPNSADSQFYIALGAIPHLDGKYTVFGEVLRGMSVVDSIATVKTDMRDVPVEDVRINSVRIVSKREVGLE